MPRKKKTLPAIPAELLEQFGSGPMTAEADLGPPAKLRRQCCGYLPLEH